MADLESLARELEVLKTQNAMLVRRIADLEERTDNHVGIDYGASQQLAPHPSMLINVAEFGGGTERLDQTGIQMLLAALSTSTQITWTANTFSETPQYTYPHVQLVGYLTTGDVQWKVEATDSTAGNSYGGYQISMTGGTPYVSMYLHDSNNGDANVQFYEVNNFARLELVSAILALDNMTSDQTGSLVDGALWYRSDSDRVRVQANSIIRNLTMDGTNTTLTIATGAVAITTSLHAIDTEAAAATDDLDTITGGQTGQVLYIHAADSTHDVVAKDGTGNLKLAGDFTMNNAEDTLTLIYNGTNWLELCRSDNGA
jgi:hypothetical protein